MPRERFAGPPELVRARDPTQRVPDARVFHAESQARLRASAERVFAHLDDHSRLSEHMTRRSWRLGWGQMRLHLDERAGRAVGSHIRLDGRVFGVRLSLEEVVTEYAPPSLKVWKTVGTPRLLVIGPYRMGFRLAPADSDAVVLTVFIDYTLPARGFSRLLGRLLGGFYAQWCTSRMLADARRAFDAESRSTPPRRLATLVRSSLFHAELGLWLLAPALAIAGSPRAAAASAALALALDVAGRLWARRSPAPMPYFMRWLLRLPRGPHSPMRLLRLLSPRSGERILEIGPGVGVHAIPIAAALQPAGTLDALDAQQPMLDALARNAARHGLGNITPRQGDAQRLPYPDACFDAAYLVSVLGEIPDAPAALHELRRVLRPGGRLLVAEVLLDPDFIPLPALRELAAQAGFVYERKAGVRFVYTALFRCPEGK